MNIEEGSFVLLCGESGCGKSTLLKLIKREISPFGEVSGNIFYKGKLLNKLDTITSVCEIGFVGQNPDEQIVTDKVWHELAFGLENMGKDSSTIRCRVGEMASYFGIQSWYHKNTDELSGGQKQILNLASVMAMQPNVILLDEPTSQLDPIAASEFISTLRKLNTEIGLTVILVEHRLEEVFPISDKVIVMEKGKVICNGTPQEVCFELKNHNFFASMPSPAKIWSKLKNNCCCPLTVKEGRSFLHTYYNCQQVKKGIPEKELINAETILEAKEVYFRYDKNSPDVLSNFNLTVKKGEIFSILGGNGTGKTTALNILSGLDKPYRGKVNIARKKISQYKGNSLYHGVLTLLPQNPKDVFIENTVKKDFEEILKAIDCPDTELESRISDIVDLLDISNLLDKHPYDISGGEQQKCAFAKVLLTEPQIILLDEPTKGIDSFYKNKLAEIILNLKKQGKTILTVTHDVEFSAIVSDRCGLFFNGEIISVSTPNHFFSENNFYTTSASRMSRGLLKNAVLCDEVVRLCKES